MILKTHLLMLCVVQNKIYVTYIEQKYYSDLTILDFNIH